MHTNEHLRFIDENTFQEANPPEDRSRPLEWRRSLNKISFESSSASVEYHYTVNEVDYCALFDDGPQENPKHVVSAAARRRIRVGFSVSREKIRDNLLITEKVEDEESIYRLRYPKGDVQILLQEAESTEQRGPFATGAYSGVAFLSDHKGTSNRLFIEVGVPGRQIEEIAGLLEKKGSKSLHVDISLQSFSYEVDDALLDWYHARDLFIHGTVTQAALIHVSVLPSTPENEVSEECEQVEDEEDVVEEQFITGALLPDHKAPDYTPILKGIRTSLWVLATLMVMILIK